MSQSPDTLSTASRAFYERSIFKTFLSIVFAAFSLMFLGFCAEAGGLSRSNQEILNSYPSTTPSDYEDSQTSLVGGYGFASFCFFVAFVLALVAAIHVSPLISGSANEAKTVKTPIEV